MATRNVNRRDRRIRRARHTLRAQRAPRLTGAAMANGVAIARVPLIAGNKRPADVTREVLSALDARPTAIWWGGMAVSVSALLLGTVAIGYQIATGIGTWGLNRTVG